MGSESPDFSILRYTLEVTLDNESGDVAVVIELNNVGTSCSDEQLSIVTHIHRADSRHELHLTIEVNSRGNLHLGIPDHDFTIVAASKEQIVTRTLD